MSNFGFFHELEIWLLPNTPTWTIQILNIVVFQFQQWSTVAGQVIIFFLAVDGYHALGQEICIGAKGDNYGFFDLPKSGILEGMKFIWKDGGVTCKESEPTYFSRFGCNHHSVKRAFSIYVTTARHEVILPDNANQKHPNDPTKYYTVIGQDARTADEFSLNAENPTYVNKSDEIRIWYGEDLHGHHHHANDNGASKVCVDVYGKFVGEWTQLSSFSLHWYVSYT